MNNDSKKYGIRSWKKIKDRFFSPAVITFNYWRFEAKTAQSKFIYICIYGFLNMTPYFITLSNGPCSGPVT